MEPDLTVTKRKATDAVEALSPLQSTQKFAKSKLALAANDVIYTHSLVGFTRKARVITAHHNFHAGLERAHQLDQPASCPALKGHYREPNDFGIERANQGGAGPRFQRERSVPRWACGRRRGACARNSPAWRAEGRS